MKIGLQIPNFTFPNGPTGFSEDLKNIVTSADQSGFSSIWVMDHFFQIGGPTGSPILGPAEDDMHEGYTLLGYIAGLTNSVKLGTMVTGNIYRNPGILAKIVTTLDVISKGRAYLGIGAGWMQREAEAFGIPFKNFSYRFELLEEALQIIKQMWSDNNGEWKGKHYHFKETMNHPMPISKPHPPILIGGMGPKKTLKFVAKYADATNLFTGRGMDALKGALDTLKQHCQNEDRPYDEIEKTTLSSSFLGLKDAPSSGLKTSSEILSHLQELSELGVDHAIFNMRDPYNLKNIEIFRDEIIPEAKKL